MLEPLPLDAPAPDAIEPIIGWRAWTLRERGGWLQLAPMVQAPSWIPRCAIHAFCLSRYRRRHRAPERTCACGVYALSSLDALSPSYGPARNMAVVGSVALWGTVIEHASGYRAEFAYPDRIRLVCPRCLGERREGIPDRLFKGKGSLWIPTCAEHAPAGEVDSLPAEEVQGRLLSVYGVDLLPVDALHAAGFGEEPVVEPDAPAPREPRRTKQHPVAITILSVVLALVIVRSLGLFGAGEGSDPPTLVPAAPAVVREPRPRPSPASRPERRTRPWGFAAVCAEELPGGAARIRACGHPRAHLFGSAESPAEPRSSCGPGEAYTRKHRFSVCWFRFETAEARVLRLPGVRWWDIHP